MNLPISKLTNSYLDPQQLGDSLHLSERTVIVRAKRRPWLLPPRAEFYDRELLRWRQNAVQEWFFVSHLFLLASDTQQVP
ncbi:hypothetical protein [Caballeronia sp. LZ019]|uniref:hypothetical protein n=1 Tax=Caballeronia sp. LZ019 TaxID=3038555 RepID=UPI00285B070A|nr:hypothetical protein [Caballeronia sp. LZ019]MDR5810622.1 hypothetical protein [Caballeronia sp. LZ019]